MKELIGTLVRRKIGGPSGVLISTTPYEESNGCECEVAFGYYCKADALAGKRRNMQWTIVNSQQIEFISQFR